MNSTNPVSAFFASPMSVGDWMVFGKKTIHVLLNEGNFDDEDNQIESTSEKWKTFTIGQLLTKWYSGFSVADCEDIERFQKLFGFNPNNDEQYDKADMPQGWQMQYFDNEMVSIRDIINEMYCDIESGIWCAILTKKDVARYKDDRWAKKLNETAANYCSANKVEFGSIPFFNSIHKDIRMHKRDAENYFSGESQAERYATYQAAGSRSFYEDNDFMATRFNQPINKLQELLRFCQLKIPCQYALWRESRKK